MLILSFEIFFAFESFLLLKFPINLLRLGIVIFPEQHKFFQLSKGAKVRSKQMFSFFGARKVKN